jgi:hypothetical protein
VTAPDSATPMDPQQVQAAVATVAQARTAQGLPPTVRDARVLRQVADLVSQARRRRGSAEVSRPAEKSA